MHWAGGQWEVGGPVGGASSHRAPTYVLNPMAGVIPTPLSSAFANPGTVTRSSARAVILESIRAMRLRIVAEAALALDA